MKIVAYNKCSLIDYDPYLAAVVFTPGCNMTCAYCHNWDLLHSINYFNEDKIFNHLSQERQRQMLDAVVISGGEPTLQGQAVLDFIKKIKPLGYKIKLDTNGSNPHLLRQLIDGDYIDYIAMDIKATPEDYIKVSGLAYDRVKQAIPILRNFGQYEFRTTVYPQISLESLDRLCRTHQHDHYFLQQYRKVTQHGLTPYAPARLKEIADRYGIPVRGI